MSAAEQLIGQVDQKTLPDYAFADILPKQLEAIGERFKDRVEKIKLLQNRAETGGIKEITSMADVVPLLFAHTAYKSYPEGWLMDQKWDRMGKWLDTVSTNRVKPMDTSGVKGLDGWLDLLVENGHYVSCSSGTTGKCAMMNATTKDNNFAGDCLLQGHYWANIIPNHDKRMISLGQVAATPRNRSTGRPMTEAFTAPGTTPFAPNVPPITIGGITDMVLLRKKIADGTAMPAEIAKFEAEATAREGSIASAVEQAADALIASREMDLHIMGLFGPLYQVSELLRSRGYSAKDFSPRNTSFISGGLKRANVPANYREIIFDTLNLAPDRLCQAYGMQELNTTAIRCKAHRYHMAPWVMLLLLDESGDNLIEPVPHGEIEGRAGFFDLSMDGRWGGIITGDKVRATWEPCECGNRSPSVHYDIQRYADSATGDKIACSGTIDAYVRGVA